MSRPSFDGTDFGMFCLALGFVLASIVLTAATVIAVLFAALYAPVAVAVAFVCYLVDKALDVFVKKERR